MPFQEGRKLSDAELDRRARELFAEVRAEHPETKTGWALNSTGNAASEVGGDMLDWLFGNGTDDDACGDDSGD